MSARFRPAFVGGAVVRLNQQVHSLFLSERTIAEMNSEPHILWILLLQAGCAATAMTVLYANAPRGPEELQKR